MIARQLAAPRSENLLAPLHAAGIRLELARFDSLLGRLGDPHLALPTVLVAGTNGKGSTAALLAAIAHAAGYKVGLYTSPHLETVLERIRFDGRTIADDRLFDVLERVLAEARRDHLPTHFEALTGAAFLAFAEADLDLAVLEVGLGGRLDATNVAKPLLSLVTTIDFDHQEFLGDGLAAIAREKAGILRADRPALFGRIEGEALATLNAVAVEKGARLDSSAGLWAARSVSLEDDAQTLEIEAPGGTTWRTRLALVGEHQAGNALLAVRAAHALAALGFPGLDQACFAQAGLAACRWPGRLEVVRLDSGRSVVFDGAHNAAGAAALERHVATWPGPFDALVGALVDKHSQDWMPPLVRNAQRVWTTSVPSQRGLSAEQLAASLGPRAMAISEPESALLEALSGPSRRLLITGSLYLVGALREALRGLKGRPVATHEAALF